jgi:UPF0755 protein
MKRTLLSLCLVIAVVIILSSIWINRDMQAYLNAPVNLQEDNIFTIQPGDNLSVIARALNEAGIIDKPVYFIATARLRGIDHQLKAGEYVIASDMTPIDILSIFVQGKVKQYSLTLIEGWTFREVISAIKDHPALNITLADNSNEFIMSELGSPELSPEGQFFPDTYHFPYGTTDIEFLRRSHRQLQSVLLDEWEKRSENLPYQQAYDALIMASLIEKETGIPEERDRIAGVFVRRLARGMRLQTDPTVIYAMGKNFDGNIRRKDLDIDSPYNTYRNPGLPPTPIALAGREAIHAALHPSDGKDLYFVATGDGGHYFSETLEEHNKAVRKYQLGQ